MHTRSAEINGGAVVACGWDAANERYVPIQVDVDGIAQFNGAVAQISRGYSAAAVFTPAAASHVAGDVHGGAQEFASIGPSAGRIKIVGASLLIAGGTIETTAWQLHLFSVTPPSALADDAAFALASGDRASYLGFLDLAQVVDVGDSLYIQTNNIFKPIKLAGTSLFAYLVNTTTLTPQAVAHTVTLHAEAF